jgi:2'-5' RNA ligase
MATEYFKDELNGLLDALGVSYETFDKIVYSSDVKKALRDFAPHITVGAVSYANPCRSVSGDDCWDPESRSYEVSSPIRQCKCSSCFR